jgi:hypothetical protein
VTSSPEMTVLEIRWEGNTPGLAAQRLSVSSFGLALELLLAALRSIASGLVNEATDASVSGMPPGTLKEAAQRLDLEIQRIGDGMVEMAVLCTSQSLPGQTQRLLEELPYRAVMAFLDAVEAEVKGRAGNVRVRQYLSSLPNGLQMQQYTVRAAGKERTLMIGTLYKPDAKGPLPGLVEIEAHIVGVGFNPGQSELQFSNGERQLTCSATVEQVETALRLREAPVRALIAVDQGLEKGPLRLLWIRPAGLKVQPDEKLTEQYLFERWDALLARLAK